jgi:hypothetical protein
MIECYYHWCPRHDKQEPFCADPGVTGDETGEWLRCQASPTQLEEFRQLRTQELDRR